MFRIMNISVLGDDASKAKRAAAGIDQKWPLATLTNFLRKAGGRTSVDGTKVSALFGDRSTIVADMMPSAMAHPLVRSESGLPIPEGEKARAKKRVTRARMVDEGLEIEVVETFFYDGKKSRSVTVEVPFDAEHVQQIRELIAPGEHDVLRGILMLAQDIGGTDKDALARNPAAVEKLLRYVASARAHFGELGD